MFKNVASQKVVLIAYDATTGVPKTGDAANLTAYVSKDAAAPAALADTSATELDATNLPGAYAFDVAQGESNADMLVFGGKSSTANIKLDSLIVFTRPPNFNALAITGGAVNLSAAAVAAIWDALTSALTTAGSIGKLLVDNINATISSRLATAGYTAPPAAAAIATAVWDHLTSAIATVGSIGKLLVDRIDAAISSRGTSTLTQAESQTAATAALNAYDPPTRAEATTDKDAVIAAIPSAATVAAAVQTSAASTPLPSNVKKINDVVIAGTGVQGDEFEP